MDSREEGFRFVNPVTLFTASMAPMYSLRHSSGDIEPFSFASRSWASRA